MNGEEIRKLRLADPFRPFNLVLTNGRKLPVMKSHDLAMSIDGELLVLSSAQGIRWFGAKGVREVNFDVRSSATKRRNGRHKGRA
jgi:hypothetical protein